MSTPSEEGAANLGFAGQQVVLEQILAWLPSGACVLLSADRFSPSMALFGWLQAHGWSDRLRLKGNVLADTGQGDETTTGALAHGVTERDFAGVRLFAQGAITNLGIPHEDGHPEPWIIAIDAAPTRASVLDDAARWAIEPMFSDVKGRGFDLEDAQLQHAERLERLALIMALAMYWCVRAGRDEALNDPTPLEKKSRRRTTPRIGASGNSIAAWSRGLLAACAV
ncbi:hypothetical protein [Thiocystis violascens]|uniref:hypothetical protein n=1 Tax=Thiocystis violascens TaxID=73141 RepID=UPI001FE23CBF|nr:hypothetical protein [Thiocystis violascens]